MHQTVEIDHEVFAGKGARVVNAVIDTMLCIICMALFHLTVLLLYRYADMQGLYLWYAERSALTSLLIAVAITAGYYIILEGVAGTTPGKLASGTRLVNEQGAKPEFKAVAIRTLIRLLPFEVFTFIGENAVGLHDSASKTYVIDIHKYNHALRAKAHAGYTNTIGLTE